VHSTSVAHGCELLAAAQPSQRYPPIIIIIIIIIIITRLVTHVKSFTKWRIASAGGHESAKL